MNTLAMERPLITLQEWSVIDKDNVSRSMIPKAISKDLLRRDCRNMGHQKLKWKTVSYRWMCFRYYHPLRQEYDTTFQDHKQQDRKKQSYQWSDFFRPLFDSKTLKWTSLPVGLGIIYLCSMHLYHVLKREREKRRRLEQTESTLGSPDEIAISREPWQVTLLRKLPLRTLSRMWGTVTHTDLPEFMRKPVYRAWAYMFQSNLSEAEETDLRTYRNLAEFFVRRLKPGIRPISDALVVSPADGRILHFGTVHNGWLEQVKGVSYRLEAFFGYGHQLEPDGVRHLTHPESFLALNLKDGKLTQIHHQLYFCVIYLAPGDYHRFHSPANWEVYSRRHFPLKLVRGVFVYNERVALLGEWPYGFFSMTAIGATNVGSIRIYFDNDLETNARVYHRLKQRYSKEQETPAARFYLPKDYTQSHKGHPIHLIKGVEIGAFHLGSSIALVFEAPSNFEFTVTPNQKIRLGEPLGDIRTHVIPLDGTTIPPKLSGKETPFKAVQISSTETLAETTLGNRDHNPTSTDNPPSPPSSSSSSSSSL
jgi:phosphatidylserine decarboxylase